MNIIIYLGISTVLLLICMLVLQIMGRRRIIFKEEEYIVASKHLELIINCYKNSILTPKVEALQQSHDLDKKSQFNAIGKFIDLSNNLTSEAAKDILENYTNEKSKIVLAKYFSADALTLFVIANLKG